MTSNKPSSSKKVSDRLGRPVIRCREEVTDNYNGRVGHRDVSF